MEMCGGGDLLSYIKRRKRLSEEVSCYMFKQICEAVEYCHSMNVAHRDIKPDNILLQEEGKIKLADFGCSKFIKGNFKDKVGSPAFVAPEIHKS